MCLFWNVRNLSITHNSNMMGIVQNEIFIIQQNLDQFHCQVFFYFMEEHAIIDDY